MEVRNCKGCGRLFNYMGRTLCPECQKGQEDEFQKVKEYIRENPMSGVADVAEATGVSVHQIRQWIREERLMLTDVSASAGINCDSCGRPILTGKLCASCKRQMKNDLTNAFSGTVAAKPQQERNGDRMRYLTKDNK